MFLWQNAGLTNKWKKLIWERVKRAGQFSQFSHSVVSDSLQPHEPQHGRPPCPSQTPEVHSDSCPSSKWCHPAFSTYVVPFSSCSQSLPASESFPMSQLFTWGGQSTGVSALASVLPKNTQGWSPLTTQMFLNGWMDKPTVVYSYNEIPSWQQKGMTKTQAVSWINLKCIILGKRSQTQKAT